MHQLHPRLAVVLHADDFLNPALRAYALYRLRPDGDGWYRPASYDSEADTVTCPMPLYAPVDAPVLVDGLFLHRDELVDLWDMSIFLDVPFARQARARTRPGLPR